MSEGGEMEDWRIGKGRRGMQKGELTKLNSKILCNPRKELGSK